MMDFLSCYYIFSIFSVHSVHSVHNAKQQSTSMSNVKQKLNVSCRALFDIVQSTVFIFLFVTPIFRLKITTYNSIESLV